MRRGRARTRIKEKRKRREGERESWLALVFEFKYQSVGAEREREGERESESEPRVSTSPCSSRKTPVTLTLSLREINEAKWVPWPRYRGSEPFLDLFLPPALDFSLFQPPPPRALRRVLLVFRSSPNSRRFETRTALDFDPFDFVPIPRLSSDLRRTMHPRRIHVSLLDRISWRERERERGANIER